MDLFPKLPERKEVPVVVEADPPLSSWIRQKKKDLESLPFVSNPSAITHIIIHHSFTKDGIAPDWTAIRKYHIEVNKWSDIGYHLGVEKVGDDYQVMLGRSLDKRGAHCKDGAFNNCSIGICLVGNWDISEPPEKQWLLALELVNYVRAYFLKKGMDVPASRVIGHREAQEIAGLKPEQRKSCPGKMFDMNKFRANLSR